MLSLRPSATNKKKGENGSPYRRSLPTLKSSARISLTKMDIELSKYKLSSTLTMEKNYDEIIIIKKVWTRIL
jgi:hypothetical protein